MAVAALPCFCHVVPNMEQDDTPCQRRTRHEWLPIQEGLYTRSQTVLTKHNHICIIIWNFFCIRLNIWSWMLRESQKREAIAPGAPPSLPLNGKPTNGSQHGATQWIYSGLNRKDPMDPKNELCCLISGVSQYGVWTINPFNAHLVHKEYSYQYQLELISA